MIYFFISLFFFSPLVHCFKPTLSSSHCQEYEDYYELLEYVDSLPKGREKSILASADLTISKEIVSKMVVRSKKITIRGFSGAFNPSIVKYKSGYLMTFRYTPDLSQNWFSIIGLVQLDRHFTQIGEAQILSTRVAGDETDSQSEDARIFVHNNELFITYNDNIEIESPSAKERRDIYFAKIEEEDGRFVLKERSLCIAREEYPFQTWQKNWVPFTWNSQLLISYSLDPHEVIYPIFSSGVCEKIVTSKPLHNWTYGKLRGGTPALRIGDEYLAFFHSSVISNSIYSQGKCIHHYFMGAYTFEKDPPFHITKITPFPIVGKGFYTTSNYSKRVVFPGGFIDDGNYFHVAFGKDDKEIWISTIDKKRLFDQMLPVNSLLLKK